MEWASITPREGLRRLKSGASALDVRSQGEFEHGSIPGFTNVPILNDDHRHQVGLTYKNSGQAEAIALGHRLVESLKDGMVNRWCSILEGADPDRRLLICWRGGLRSKLAAEWLAARSMAGVRVAGGYKAMRAELTALAENPPGLYVLGGLTGSGKTELLRELPGAHVLDLEAYANHRGSSFGLKMDSRQPHQQTFENSVGLALLDAPGVMAVEAESRMIGRCLVPDALKEAMDRSPMIVLETGLEERARRIFAEYVLEPAGRASANELHGFLAAALERVHRRLGGLRFQRIRSELQAAFTAPEYEFENHAPWIESLLREYYDPLYEHSLRVNERPVLFRGDHAAVKDFLADRFDRRRA
jgi:tRNA 2-selenouridine synthase